MIYNTQFISCHLIMNVFPISLLKSCSKLKSSKLTRGYAGHRIYIADCCFSLQPDCKRLRLTYLHIWKCTLKYINLLTFLPWNTTLIWHLSYILFSIESRQILELTLIVLYLLSSYNPLLAIFELINGKFCNLKKDQIFSFKFRDFFEKCNNPVKFKIYSISHLWLM